MNDFSFSDLQVGDESCFLCGVKDQPLTQEHVFPKWLQRRYNLLTETIVLLNNTKIQYQNLKVPCCEKCNREDLSRLEKKISSAISGGFEATSKIDPHLLYLWVGKLYFGVLRKELSLARDRAKPNGEAILSKEAIRSFTALHLFLQAIRGRHEFSGRPPYSVLVCNLHELDSPRKFCFRDSYFGMTIGIRLGEVGIIVVLEDAGLTTETYGRYIDDAAGKKIHPIQFDELYAKVLYQISRIENCLTFISTKHESDLQPVQTIVVNDLYLRERSQEEFSKLLWTIVSGWFHSDAEMVEWITPPTWMNDEHGNLLFRSLAEWEQSLG